MGAIELLKFATHIGRMLKSNDLLIDALGEIVKVQDVSGIFEFWVICGLKGRNECRKIAIFELDSLFLSLFILT